MATDFILNGVRARMHNASNTKITEDGKYVEKEWFTEGKLETYSPQILKDNSGYHYIVNKKIGNVYIHKMVMECFGPPMPIDGQDYVIVHLDGDKTNNHYTNLAWKTRKDAYPHIPANTDKEVKLNHGIVVHKDGRIYQKGKKCHVTDDLYDSDMDLFVPMPPYIRYEYKNYWKKTETAKLDVEDAMAAAGYVDGNKLQFKNPVILHKDGDYSNCASENLRWCDATDPDYIDYYNKMADTMNALGRERNKYWPESKDWKKL